MDQTTIIRLVQKELEELGLLLQGVDGMVDIPQPIKSLTISKAEHLLDALRKLEYTREEDLPEIVATVSKEKSTSTIDESKKPEPVKTLEEDIIPEPEPIEATVAEAAEEQQISGSEAEVEVEAIKEIVKPLIEKVEDQIELTKPENLVEIKHENAAKQILGESIKAGVKIGDVIGGEGRGSIGSRLEASSIKDLKRAISIADRFRYQKDLFGNNSDLMNGTLDKLNTLHSLEEAIACISDDFDWSDDLESKKDFINLISRRFQ